MNRVGCDMAQDELLRLKKALQFIRQVIQDYARNPHYHLGFSLALATSKAEELSFLVEPFCPAKNAFQKLVEAMKVMSLEPSKVSEAERCLDQIFSCFELEHLSLIRR